MEFSIETKNCWIWIGVLDRKGYGKIGLKVDNKHKTILAHRLSFELHYGKIKDKMVICHSCDNPKCVNPKHLWQGTQSDNIKDMFSKGRDNLPNQKGEQNPRSILNWKEVREIRRSYKKSKNKRVLTQANLANEYNVSRQCIQSIVNNHNWIE